MAKPKPSPPKPRPGDNAAQRQPSADQAKATAVSPAQRRPAGPRPRRAGGPPGGRAPPSAKIEELTGQVSTLSKSLDEEKQQLRSVDEKVAGVEDRIKSLMKLSELLSVRYNPFLEESEGALFDERYTADELVARLAGGDVRLADTGPGGPASRQEPAGDEAVEQPQDKFSRSPLREVIRPEADRSPADHESADSDRAPATRDEAPSEAAQSGPPKQEPSPRVPRRQEPPDLMPSDLEARVDQLLERLLGSDGPPRRPAVEAGPETSDSSAGAGDARTQRQPPAPAEPKATQATSPPIPAPLPHEAPTAPSAPLRSQDRATTMPAIQATAQEAKPGLRQSYLAIAWLDYLSDVGSPEALHPLLNYYRHVGWLDPSTHQWLAALAAGITDVAGQADDSSAGAPQWTKLGLDPRGLARLHQQSLRFLELLRHGLHEEDFDRVEAAARSLLGEI